MIFNQLLIYFELISFFFFLPRNLNVVVFCQRVQDKESNVFLFSTNQIADILYVSSNNCY